MDGKKRPEKARIRKRKALQSDAARCAELSNIFTKGQATDQPR